MVRVDSTGRSNSLIQVRGLDKTYKRGGEEIHVLQGLNLDVDKGDFVAFMGPSGSGKTTLLNLLGGLDVPTRGSYLLDGKDAWGLQWDGSYLRIGSDGLSAQEALMDRFRPA